MRKNGWKLLLVLLCVAFLVSCGKKEIHDGETAELVSAERGAAECGALFFARQFLFTSGQFWNRI